MLADRKSVGLPWNTSFLFLVHSSKSAGWSSGVGLSYLTDCCFTGLPTSRWHTWLCTWRQLSLRDLCRSPSTWIRHVDPPSHPPQEPSASPNPSETSVNGSPTGRTRCRSHQRDPRPTWSKIETVPRSGQSRWTSRCLPLTGRYSSPPLIETPCAWQRLTFYVLIFWKIDFTSNKSVEPWLWVMLTVWMCLVSGMALLDFAVIFNIYLRRWLGQWLLFRPIANYLETVIPNFGRLWGVAYYVFCLKVKATYERYRAGGLGWVGETMALLEILPHQKSKAQTDARILWQF